jgi:chromosomal replication initiator protein
MQQILNKTDKIEEFSSAFFNKCKSEFGEENFTKWLSKLDIHLLGCSELVLSAQSKFLRDWVTREFLTSKKSNLQKIAESVDGKIKKVSIIYIQRNEDSLGQVALQDDRQFANNPQPVVNLSKYDNVFAFGTDLNPKFTFETFVSAKYNKLALSMAKIAAGFDNQMKLFDDAIPLYIHGGIGLGKTHLAQAIAWHIKENNHKKKVVYLSAEKFMYHFVQSLRSNDIMAFKEKFRSIDVLIIDDIQFIAGKQGTQEEFMHSFNNLVDSNKQVVLVCDRSPSDLTAVDEKLKSRISGGMIVNFKNPNYEDRLEVIRYKASALSEKIDPKILEFFATKITTNIRDLDGALKKLIANKIFINEEISMEGAKIIALDYCSSKKPNSIEKIQKIIAGHFEIKISQMLSNSRTNNISHPRQIAMYFSKMMTSENLQSIAREFGNKNHATVIYAIKSINKQIQSDLEFLKMIKNLEEKIENC